MFVTEINSSSNAQFKTWKSLLTSKGIKKEGLFLLSGSKLFAEVLQEGCFEVTAELIPSRGEPLTRSKQAFKLSADLFRELDELGTHHNILVLKTPTLPKWDSSMSAEGLEVFSPLGDPQNLGAVVRSSEAFGASKVVLLEESANPFLPKTIKASAGSVLRMPLMKGPKLSELGGEFVSLEANGSKLTDHKWNSNVRLLVGEEGPGLANLSSGAKVKTLSIPTQNVESLNAGVAVSIALFHYRQQFSL